MKARVLKVLMWKHAVVRKRRFIHTIVDLIFPLLFFALLYFFKNMVHVSFEPENPESAVAYTDVLELTDSMLPPLRILYYPDTPLTQSLMNEVGRKFNLKRLDHFPESTERGYYPYSNESQIHEFTSKMKITDAIVIFQDMSKETWPEKLNYTIRMKDIFRTESYEPNDDNPGPHKMFGLNYGTFMRIQWAIDTSYIKLLTGNEIPQTVSMQEFPYYRTNRNLIAVIVCRMATMLTWLSLLLTFVFLVSRLLQERASGIQELMKMVGVTVNTLGVSHFLNVLPCGLVFSIGSTLLLKLSSEPIIPHTNGFLIFLAFLLFFNTIVSMAFVTSYIANTTQYSATLSVMVYVMMCIPVRLVEEYDSKISYAVNIITGLVPQRPLTWFWDEVAALEMYDKGATFSNMMKTHSYNNGSVFLSYVFMLIQSGIFYFIAWYLSKTRPGKYGQAMPMNFLFKTEYWRRNRNDVYPNASEEEDPIVSQDPKYFESAPSHAEVGIKIANVSKVYDKHRVLKNVSLEVYKGEITVLLGHNGAGKTTLMSIITGMTSATEGKVYVNGKDTVTQEEEVRQDIGLCPQHNLFFEDLTVDEQIKFFTLLKHGTFAQAKQTSRDLAAQLKLTEKLHSLIKNLSGGQKRRAQVACALAGGASVLILDEPTSGLDVETRRELWDLLLTLRGDRTVLLTTHFMEEADALGDRVAALHAGTLRCYATTMHLKKAVGTGYRLSFTTIGIPKEASITKVVTTHVYDATVKEKTINTISYSLPASASRRFPKLFTVLESNRSSLGIDTIGVGISTLEEVFLQLCSDVDTRLMEELDNLPVQEVAVKKVTGFSLCLQQFKVLMMRQLQYALYKWIVFLVMQVLLPLGVIVAFSHLLNNAPEPPLRSLSMDLDLYGDRTDRLVLYKVEAPDVNPEVVTRRYPRVTFSDTNDVVSAVLRTAKKDILEYNKYIAGVEINETDAKILYTTTIRHAAPVALNLLSNMLATRYISWADGHTINTINEPVQTKSMADLKIEEPKQLDLLITWGAFMTFILLATNINNISLVCTERASSARHIHVMSGCAPEVHWLTTLTFHMTLCTLTLVYPIIIAAALLDKDNTINQPDFLAAFLLVLILGSLSFMAFMYLISFNQGERATSVVLVACIILFGVFTPSMKSIESREDKPHNSLHRFLLFCDWTIPPHTLVVAALQSLMVCRVNAWCHRVRDRCPNIFIPEYGFDAKKCCDGENPQGYFTLGTFGPGLSMIALALQSVVLMTLVILTERGVFNGLWEKVLNAKYNPPSAPDADEMVRAEKEYVSKAITLPTKQIPDALLVDNLHKNYVPIIKSRCNALKGISFSVKKGECFGLLGVNGAGKSTTFKTLTAEECPTRGNIFGNGYHLKRGNSQYLQTLGYCPQFFGLDMFLTGEQNLKLVLTLRGFNHHFVKEDTKNWIQIIGLEKYATRPVETYSGGCVRRLGTAAALCGRAQLALLDEPTAGVDVAARRKLWTALRVALRQQRSIIITSHSMDEMEALCSRVAILAAGRVRALGTAAGLRAAHAQGHAVIFKLRHVTSYDQVDGAQAEVNQLKGKVQEKFDCTLKDEHKTMLHYHINETLRYSELFAELEILRKEFSHFLEDYSVTETTLEEVFLAFAKEASQQDPDPSAHPA